MLDNGICVATLLRPLRATKKTLWSVATATPLSRCCRRINPASSRNADAGPQVQPTSPKDIFVPVQVVVDDLPLAVVVFLTPRGGVLTPLGVDKVAEFFCSHNARPHYA